MSSKLEREAEFDRIFDEMVKKKKPDAEVVVGIGVGKKKKSNTDEEMTENPEENQEEEALDVNTLVDLIKNASSFEDLQASLTEMLNNKK